MNYIKAITESGLTIYDPIKPGSSLWIDNKNLENILQNKLSKLSLDGLSPRTRSKVVKEAVCSALGYPIPSSFKKTQPRFISQDFDVYIQKSFNLQIWNEEISPKRRYVIIQVLDEKIGKVKVVNGEDLMNYDTTGTLTIKHQASFVPNNNFSELISSDTDYLKQAVVNFEDKNKEKNPTKKPSSNNILSIEKIFDILKVIVGMTFPDTGRDQDRNRGGELHKIVCKKLGYSNYSDNGQFPDILNQLLEIKLQTSPTIDLGKICPNSTSNLDGIIINKKEIRHCDVRYALFYGIIEDGEVKITHFTLTSGEAFFNRFPQLQGNVINKKIQLPLPRNFFDL